MAVEDHLVHQSKAHNKQGWCSPNPKPYTRHTIKNVQYISSCHAPTSNTCVGKILLTTKLRAKGVWKLTVCLSDSKWKKRLRSSSKAWHVMLDTCVDLFGVWCPGSASSSTSIHPKPHTWWVESDCTSECKIDWLFPWTSVGMRMASTFVFNSYVRFVDVGAIAYYSFHSSISKVLWKMYVHGKGRCLKSISKSLIHALGLSCSTRLRKRAI